MSRRLPSLNALRAFEAAARYESLTAAAEELHVTHGAISRQLAALETWLGVALFERQGRRVRLTSGGRDYRDSLSWAFDRIAEATRRVQETGSERTLIINALPTFTMRWLLPRLAQFQRANPGIVLRLVTSDRPLHEVGEPYDVAIRRGPEAWPGHAAAPFLTEWSVPILSPGLAVREPLREPGDLARHTLLHADTRPGAWRRWLVAAGVSNLVPGGQQRFDHFYLALQAAADGLGVALGPLPILADDVAAGRLFAPLMTPRVSERSYWHAVPHARAQDPALLLFCRWLDGEGRRSEGGSMSLADPVTPISQAIPTSQIVGDEAGFI